MATDHKGRPIGNPNTSHGGHEPTPLERWNKHKTQAEKDKDRFRGYEEEIVKTGGDPSALASPYLDPYDFEEPDQSWRTINIDPKD